MIQALTSRQCLGYMHLGRTMDLVVGGTPLSQ